MDQHLTFFIISLNAQWQPLLNFVILRSLKPKLALPQKQLKFCYEKLKHTLIYLCIPLIVQVVVTIKFPFCIIAVQLMGCHSAKSVDSDSACEVWLSGRSGVALFKRQFVNCWV